MHPTVRHFLVSFLLLFRCFFGSTPRVTFLLLWIFWVFGPCGSFCLTTLVHHHRGIAGDWIWHRQNQIARRKNGFWPGSRSSLEAQQRYFSYRVILVAIVSRNSFVLVFFGVSHKYRAIRSKTGIAQMCLCETKYQGGLSRLFGGVLISLKKYREIWGIAAIVSQYRAIWGH